MKIMVFAYPVSVNSYLRKTKTGMYKTMQARQFEKAFFFEAHKAKVPKHREGVLLRANIELFPPDNRKRDIDNSMKQIFDCCQQIGWCWDDRQIVKLWVEKKDRLPGGACSVELVVI